MFFLLSPNVVYSEFVQNFIFLSSKFIFFLLGRVRCQNIRDHLNIDRSLTPHPNVLSLTRNCVCFFHVFLVLAKECFEFKLANFIKGLKHVSEIELSTILFSGKFLPTVLVAVSFRIIIF